MSVDLLYHLMILTKDVEETSEFLEIALGFTDGYTPEVDFPLAWLYCGEQPVIHVVGKESPGDTGGGRIDHVAFNCSDYPGVKARLDACGATQKEQTQPNVGVHQIFVEIPEGVWLELIFNYEQYLTDTDQKAATNLTGPHLINAATITGPTLTLIDMGGTFRNDNLLSKTQRPLSLHRQSPQRMNSV